MELLTFLQFWPFSIPETIAFILAIVQMVKLALEKKWDELGRVAEKTSVDISSELMTNQKKKDLVLDAVMNVAPAWFKMFATKEKLSQFVDFVYTTRVKPLNDRERQVADTSTTENKDTDKDYIF